MTIPDSRDSSATSSSAIHAKNIAESPRREHFRAQMPITRRFAYFDHAAVSPLPQPTLVAMQQWSVEAAELGDTVWPEWAARAERARHLAAQLIAASPPEIALVPNTTTGISLVAEGFPWRTGDNVVTLANEFPSNFYPWKNLASRGVETRLVAPEGAKVPLEKIAAACDARTRIISISWVGYASGFRLDLEKVTELAHDHGTLLFVDAIQGLGVFPLNVEKIPIDFLAADGHKWLLGPEGAGVLFIRQKHLDLLRPIGVGWNSVQHRYDFSRLDLQLRPEAARYEGGSQNMAGFIGLAASLDFLLHAGVGPDASAVADRVLDLTDIACQRLTEIGAQIESCRDGVCRSGIVGFRMPGRDPMEDRQRCLAAGVVLSCRAGMLRISPHFYNDEGDVERLVQALEGSLS